MTVSKTAASITFIATAGQTVFDFGSTIDFLDDSGATVHKEGILLNEGPDYTLVGTVVTLTVGATLNDEILITRVTPLTQTKDIMDGDPMPVEVIEEGLDRVVRQVQELSEQVNDPAVVEYPLPPPEADKLIGWNAGATALENKTNELTAIQLDITALEQADAGIVNALIGLDARITALENSTVPARLDAIELVLADLVANKVTQDGRLDALEADSAVYGTDIADLQDVALLPLNFPVLDNQVTPVDTGLVVDGNVHTSLFIVYDIRRKTDTNYKSTSGTLHLVYRPNNVWATERGLTVVDLDGLTFSIVSLGGGQAKLQYISDDLSGTSYVGTCKFRMLKIKI